VNNRKPWEDERERSFPSNVLMICNQSSRQNQSNYNRYTNHIKKEQSHPFQKEKEKTKKQKTKNRKSKCTTEIFFKNNLHAERFKMFSTSWFLTALSLDTILGPPECQFPPFS
jgi:uncharacterized membrane-anchored protein